MNKIKTTSVVPFILFRSTGRKPLYEEALW